MKTLSPPRWYHVPHIARTSRNRNPIFWRIVAWCIFKRVYTQSFYAIVKFKNGDLPLHSSEELETQSQLSSSSYCLLEPLQVQ